MKNKLTVAERLFVIKDGIVLYERNVKLPEVEREKWN